MSYICSLLLVIICCFFASALHADPDAVAQIALISADYQKQMAASENFLQFTRYIPTARQNLSEQSDLIDPTAGAPMYWEAILSAPITEITIEDDGATVLNYNPIYDIGWIFHFKKDASGAFKTLSLGGYNVDGNIVVTGNLLREEKLPDLNEAPHWAKDQNLQTMSVDFTKLKIKSWQFDRIAAVGSEELKRQRRAVDDRVILLMLEQFQQGTQNLPYSSFPNLEIASKMLSCTRLNEIKLIHHCFIYDAGFNNAEGIRPEGLNVMAYKVLLGNLALAGTVTSPNGDGIIFFTSSVPIENKYVLAAFTHNKKPAALMLLPFALGYIPIQ